MSAEGAGSAERWDGQGAIFATLLTTARKLGQNLYERLCSIAGPSPLQLAGMPT
jgi:hypothetical protein